MEPFPEGGVVGPADDVQRRLRSEGLDQQVDALVGQETADEQCPPGALERPRLMAGEIDPARDDAAPVGELGVEGGSETTDGEKAGEKAMQPELPPVVRSAAAEIGRVDPRAEGGPGDEAQVGDGALPVVSVDNA